MSDQNNKNQDVNQDQNPESDFDEELALMDVDEILREEDPDFLERIKKITVQATGLDLEIMGQALGLHPKSSNRFFGNMAKPFQVRSHPKAAAVFWTSIASLAAVSYFTWTHKDSLLSNQLFLTSFADIGGEVREYNPNNETEAFYDNPRFAKNLVTISSMHVNLKASESSGPNPMLALEVTVEGLSADAIVEIKDREAEFKDKLLRLTEEKSYDELIEAEGKQILCDQYRDELNTYLTRGQVRKVLLKSFVIKP